MSDLSLRLVWGAVVLAGLLTGCGTSAVSKNIDDAGVPREVVFPDVEDHAWMKEGSWPNVDNLRQIRPGVAKDQLYDLVGRPHFREGLMSVREWDYVFHFADPAAAGKERVCQYKVVFDKNMKGQTFHWLPAACASVLAVAPAPVVVQQVAVPAPPPEPVVQRKIQLSGDALFAFSKSGIGDLRAGGRAELDRVLGALGGAGAVERMSVIGYTDRIGSEQANLALSRARAESVAGHFVSRGVPGNRIEVEGRGESEAVVQCAQTSRQALVSCLSPNRRVVINAVSRVGS